MPRSTFSEGLLYVVLQLWIFSRDYLVGIGKEHIGGLGFSLAFIVSQQNRGSKGLTNYVSPTKTIAETCHFSELRGLLGILGKPPSRINHELYHININYISQPLVVLMDHLLYSYLFWLVVWNMAFMTFHIFGMSSSQQTNIFQRG